MKVAIYYNNHDVRIEERPRPKIGPGEILVRVRSTGICGSDTMEWYRIPKAPRILGHEIAGEIAEVGNGITQFKAGDRIAASHHVPCYECHYCRLGHQTLCDTLRKTNFDPGGFAEWIRLPAINVRHGVYKLPENVSYEEATFIEPVACTLRAQKKAGVRPEQSVLVIGCGLAGLLHIATARLKGAKRVFGSDLLDFRLEAAKKMGADKVFKAAQDLGSEIREANEGRLPDVVIVCVGVDQASRQSLHLVERGGTILFYAPQNPEQQLTLPLNHVFWEQGATLMSSYAASPEDHHESLRLIASEKIRVKELITHRLGLSEAARGFELASRAQESLKIVLDPSR